MSTGTAMTISQKVTSVRTLLEKSKQQIAMALPKHCTPERMMRVAMTAIQRQPKLLECDPRTLVARVVEASQLGLEPDGVLGHAYLVPFYNGKTKTTDCQLIPGYKGLLDLSRRSGQVSTVYAKCVYTNDKYTIEYGLEPKLIHSPCPTGEPGAMVAVYAVCKLRDGGTQFEWLWKREVDATRARSKAKDSGPWITDYEAMAMKTALRRLCKLLPISVEAQQLVAQDELFDAGKDPDPSPMMDLLPEEPKTSSLDALAARFDGDEQSQQEQQTEDPPFNPPTQTEQNDDEAIILQEWTEAVEQMNGKIEIAKAKAKAHEMPISEGLRAKLMSLCDKREIAIGMARGERSNGH